MEKSTVIKKNVRPYGKFSNLINKVDNNVWKLISFLLALLVWQLISMSEAGGVIFASPIEVVQALIRQVQKGKIWIHIGKSLLRVLGGFSFGLIAAIPIAFLMGWYKVFRNIIEPWIQFIRTIPPIAYIPLVIVGAGIGESSKIIVIFIASFLVMVVSIYQGVRNVDVTLIKAAKVLGATDGVIFLKVVVPASLPFILVGIRLGLAASLTTLIASELTGAQAGLGTMIQEASLYFQMDIVLLGIVIIGVIGITLEKFVKFLERRLTAWQETHQA